MNPTLKEHLQWTKWGDHFLLFNPDNRSTLRIQSGTGLGLLWMAPISS